jgi:class 3 adenylate cyclase
MACGDELSRRCTSCNRGLPAGARFCDACGQAVDPALAPPGNADDDPGPGPDPRSYTPRHLAERILVSKAALEGERKHVTVLFADLADSTALAGRLDPEAMHQLMDRAFGHMLKAVHGYEATVNQFTGDGIMALFGAPIALEDAPRCAVMAALAMQRELLPLDEEVRTRHGVHFRMRIGIHSGPVVVGRIGDDLRMDYTAVGDTTHLANRLQSLARPGGIVISASTERLVSGFFERTALQPVTVKGVEAPVAAFEVTGERAVRGRIEAVADTGLTPFVGRRRELDALQAAFESAQRGQGQVVFLVGEAGIGKSRLRYEFRKWLSDRPHLWIEGRCASYARSSAFHPVADAVRRRFGIEERDDDASALAKLERDEDAEGGDLRWTLPLLRALLSLPVGDEAVAEMDAASRRSETYRALQTRLQRSASQQPVVLVIEDLHWIDRASEEFLTFLADSVPTSRILLLFTFRPGYQHGFGDRSYHARIALQALSADEMATMTRALLESEGLPEALRTLIARKAEGNPFFVEEVTQSLLEEGALQQTRTGLVLNQALADVAVPDRIQDVLMARLDRLPDEPKRALQVASVIGREFALRLLERISEAGDRVPGVVDELRSLELIYEKSSHPELAFMFKHALTHEVAYESILMQRRKALHLLVGASIEELYRDRLAEHYEALALHFLAAEDWERALHYHELAASKATAAYANQSVAEYCRTALEIADRIGSDVPDARRRALEERLGLACWLVSDFRASGQAYRRAAALTPDPAGQATLLAGAAYSFLWGHDYEQERAAAAEALLLAREHGNAPAEAVALTVQGCDVGWLGGDMDECARMTHQASRLAEADEGSKAFVALHLGELAEWGGNYREALRIHEPALEVARRLHRPDLVMFTSWFVGKSKCCLGLYGEAIAELSASLELSDRVGDRALKARLLNTLGWCFAEVGAYERARDFNQRSTDLGREMLELGLVAGADEVHGNAAINLAGNLISLGQLDAAHEVLDPIREGITTSRDPWMQWRYRLHLIDTLARLALSRNQPEQALQLALEEHEGARGHRSRKLEARALELAGRALLVLDRREEAEARVHAALELGRRIEYPPIVWRSLFLLGEVARRGGQGSEAERSSQEARALVERLASSLRETDLSARFHALGERLTTDPLGAYR